MKILWSENELETTFEVDKRKPNAFYVKRKQ